MSGLGEAGGAVTRLWQLIEPHPADALAVIDHDGTAITYGGLRDIVARLAEMLDAQGVRPGDRVVLVAENCALFAAAIFAAGRLDAWITLVNARQSAQEIDAILDHAGARTAIFTAQISAEALAHADRLGAIDLGETGAGPLVALPARPAMPEPVLQGSDQVAALMYTTGTTSAPKGVMLSHGNLIFNAQNGRRLFGIGPGDRSLGVLPGTHVYGFSSQFLTVMAGGAAIRYMPRFQPGRVVEALRDGITLLPAVPQMYAGIMAHLETTGEALSAPALRMISTGGAPLDPGLKARVERVFGLPLNNGYGITECAPTVAVTRNDQPRDDISVGLPMPGLDVFIDDPDEKGEGEILVRGPNVMLGYYRDPERTAEALPEPGLFRTGDLGRIDETGALWICGRKKELIIRSGFNVHPPEVEAMLSRHPALNQAAVIGRQVPGNEEILAFVTLRPGATATEEEIKAWLHDQLVAYKVPQHIFFVDSYPAAATGKILKHKLLDHFADLIAARDGRAA